MSDKDKLRCVWIKETDENIKLIQKVLTAGNEAGVGENFWSKLIANNELFRKIIVLVNIYNTDNVSEQRAQEIMGINFLSIESAIRHLNVTLSTNDLFALAQIPFTERFLEAHKTTHVLVAVPSISVMDVHKTVGELFFATPPKPTWYEKEEFALRTEQAGWYLIRKDVVPSSFGKRWSEQQILLAENEKTPSVAAMTCAIILYYLKTGIRLFEHDLVNCSDKNSDELRVYVGNFDVNGLFIGDYWHGHRTTNVNLSSCFKSG